MYWWSCDDGAKSKVDVGPCGVDHFLGDGVGKQITGHWTGCKITEVACKCLKSEDSTKKFLFSTDEGLT